jgi:predicted dehydrogenase
MTPDVRGVLAEKPLACDPPSCDRLIHLAHKSGIALAVNHTRRYSVPLANLAKLIRAGGLGTIRSVRGLYGNGTLHNGTHWFDLARLLIGEIASVRATDRLYEGGDDPTLDVSLEFTCGAVGVLQACPPRDYTIFELDVLGSAGRAQLTNMSDVLEIQYCVDGQPAPGYRGLAPASRQEKCLHNVLVEAVADLAHAVTTDAKPRCTGTDAATAVRIGCAAHLSARSACEVRL